MDENQKQLEESDGFFGPITGINSGMRILHVGNLDGGRMDYGKYAKYAFTAIYAFNQKYKDTDQQLRFFNLENVTGQKFAGRLLYLTFRAENILKAGLSTYQAVVWEKKPINKVRQTEVLSVRLKPTQGSSKEWFWESHLSRNLAQEVADEAKNEQAATSAKPKDSQKQLIKLSASKESQAEKLEATRNQLWSDLNNLKLDLTQSLSVVEKLNCQLIYCKRSKNRALKLLTKAQAKLEMAKTIGEDLRARVKTEEVSKMMAQLSMELGELKTLAEGQSEGSVNLQSELTETKAKVKQLQSDLDSAEKRCREEKDKNILLIRSAEEAEQAKTKEAHKMAQLRMELKNMITRAEKKNRGSKILQSELTKTKAKVKQLQSNSAYADVSTVLIIERARKQAEQTEVEQATREVEMGAELEKTKAKVKQLQVTLAYARDIYKEKNNVSTILIERVRKQAEQAKVEQATRDVEMGAELDKTKAEVEKLKSALKLVLDLAEENIEYPSLIRTVHNHAQQTKMQVGTREAEMKDELELVKAKMVELKAALEDVLV